MEEELQRVLNDVLSDILEEGNLHGRITRGTIGTILKEYEINCSDNIKTIIAELKSYGVHVR